jgi:hypothetical protein
MITYIEQIRDPDDVKWAVDDVSSVTSSSSSSRSSTTDAISTDSNSLFILHGMSVLSAVRTTLASCVMCLAVVMHSTVHAYSNGENAVKRSAQYADSRYKGSKQKK